MRLARSVLASIILILASVAPAMADSVVIDGGGWGHGIGMPQYGAKAMAEQGSTAIQILQYFYAGAQVGEVGDEFTQQAEPLDIGVAQKVTVSTFQAINNNVEVCLGLQCNTATPGQVWKLKADGSGNCQFERDGVPLDSPAACSGELTWISQPNTRVYFQELNRTYARGRVLFKPTPAQTVPMQVEGETFHVIVEVPLEEYLLGLGEMPSSWHMEALKAQAIAARTYALYKAYVYRSDLRESCQCHLYGSTADQSYRGWSTNFGEGGASGDRWTDAVEQTAGLGLWHNHHGSHRALEAYYYSSSGGATENNEDIWGGSPYPYLRSVDDPGPTFWDEEFSFGQFASMLGFDVVKWAEITERYVSGSPKKIVVQGTKSGSALEKTYTGGTFKSALGLISHHVFSIQGFIPPGADRVVLHDPTSGQWVYRDQGQNTSIYYGTPNDFAFFGDWDCDGTDTPGLYRRSDGYVYLRNSNTQGFANVSYFFGVPGDIPIAGDFNGDGCDTVSIYRPSAARFYVINEIGSADGGLGNADYSFLYGVHGDVPFVGDWNGDGIDTPGLRRSSNGFVYLRNSNSQGVADVNYFYGINGDVVFSGDWDADGFDTVGLYRPSNGTVYLRNSNSTGVADIFYKMGSSKHKAVAGSY